MIIPEFLKNISFPETIKENSLHPVILVTFEGKEYVVDGFKRLNSFSENSFFNIGKIDSQKDLLLLYIKLNKFRVLNIVEISHLLKNAENYFKSEKLIREICKLAEIKYSKNQIENIKNYAKLIEPAKKLLIDEKLNKHVALKLSQQEKIFQKIFIELIEHFKLNSNKQKKVYEMIFDLSKRNSISLSDTFNKYFSDYLLKKYSKSLEVSFFEKLIKLHSPNYYKFSKEFSERKKNLLKNIKGSNIVSPTNFEESQIKLELFFNDFEELKGKLQKLMENLKDEN